MKSNRGFCGKNVAKWTESVYLKSNRVHNRKSRKYAVFLLRTIFYAEIADKLNGHGPEDLRETKGGCQGRKVDYKSRF